MIFADAARAEIFKLRKNRVTLFWAFGLTPVATLVVGVAIETMARMAGASIAPANAVTSAMNGLAAAANPLVQLLLIIGAAVVFAGEYRWQTWRAVLPRSERTALLLAKFAAFMAAAALSILLCGAAGFLVGLYNAGVLHMDAVWPDAADGFVALALAFATALAQTLVVAGLAAVTAVATRSVLAAAAGPFMLLVGMELLATRISLPTADLSTAALPNIAARSLRELSLHVLGDPDAVALHLAAPGAIALLAWGVVLVLAAVVMFRRQDLSEE